MNIGSLLAWHFATNALVVVLAAMAVVVAMLLLKSLFARLASAVLSAGIVSLLLLNYSNTFKFSHPDVFPDGFTTALAVYPGFLSARVEGVEPAAFDKWVSNLGLHKDELGRLSSDIAPNGGGLIAEYNEEKRFVLMTYSSF